MRVLLHIALQLYPAAWRRRYGRELEALLEEASPGWRGLVDLFKGALTMRLKALGTIPVACAAAGAVIGAILAFRTPVLFASSATIRLKTADVATADAGMLEDVRVSLQKALDGGSTGASGPSAIKVLKNASGQTLRLTYLDRDPSRAQRVAEKLTAAIVGDTRSPARSAEVLDTPRIPPSPVAPDYPTAIASGSLVGLALGGVMLLIARSRVRRISVG